MLDSLLADLGYVYESGQIVGETDKRTVWHQRFHRSLGHEADFYIRYALLALFSFFLAQDLFCGEHELFILRIGGDDADLDLFSDPVLRIFYIFQSQLGGRDKAAHTFYISNCTAVYYTFYHYIKNLSGGFQLF